MMKMCGKKILMGLMGVVMLVFLGGMVGAADVIKPDLKVPSSSFTSLGGETVEATAFAGGSLREKLKGVVVGATSITRRAVVPIFVIVIIIMGVRLATAGDDERAKKIKDQLLISLSGIAVIVMASVMVSVLYLGGLEQEEAGGTVQIWDGSDGSILAREKLADEITGIINFAGWGLAIAAMIMIVVYGFMMFFSDGDEEDFKTNKQGVIYAGIGLVLIGMATTITKIFYGGLDQLTEEAPEFGPDGGVAVTEVTGLLNFALSFVGVVALVFVIYAGFLWMMAGEDEEAVGKSKQMMIAALVGVAVILSAFAIVNTFL